MGGSWGREGFGGSAAGISGQSGCRDSPLEVGMAKRAWLAFQEMMIPTLRDAAPEPLTGWGTAMCGSSGLDWLAVEARFGNVGVR